MVVGMRPSGYWGIITANPTFVNTEARKWHGEIQSRDCPLPVKKTAGANNLSIHLVLRPLVLENLETRGI